MSLVHESLRGRVRWARGFKRGMFRRLYEMNIGRRGIGEILHWVAGVVGNVESDAGASLCRCGIGSF